jgi:hypothetical protein
MELSITNTIILNAVLWLIIQLSVAKLILLLDWKHFTNSKWCVPVTSFEIQIYLKVLKIKKWKSLLPDAAPWLKSDFSKKKILKLNSDYLLRFISETQRAEVAHIIEFLFFPLFFLWNPWWGKLIIFFYAILSNLRTSNHFPT